jgi:hypothetical protein
MSMITRRGFIRDGLVTLLAAPAIVRVASIMPVKTLADLECFDPDILGFYNEYYLFGWSDWRGILGTYPTT